MQTQLQNLEKEALEAIANTQDLKSLQDIEVKYLGRSEAKARACPKQA